MNPFRKLGVRASMVLFAAVALGAVLMLGIAGWINLARSDALADRLATDVGLARYAGHMDMMHDGLRANVLAATVAGNAAADDVKKENLATLTEDTAEMANDLAEVERLASAGAVRDAALAAKPDVVAYIASAKDTVNTLLASGPDESKLKDFEARFRVLEKSLGTLSELIENGAKDDLAAKEAIAERARWVLALTVLAALGLTITCATLFANTTLHHLGAEPLELRSFAGHVAQGVLSGGFDNAPEPSSVAGSMLRMQDSLGATVKNIRAAADGLATASAQIAAGNGDLARRTEEQSSSLERTASAMEQLSITVKQNADNAQQANQLALGASTVAVQGGSVVAQVVDTMKGINDASRKISDIISVIDGIAFQTNILALNAAVEAARAGEQGRGFAVVASEVRSLAGRSAEAAKEIKTLINTSVERVEQGTAQVEQAGNTMHEVVTSIKRVTDIVGEISVASSEQAIGVRQIGDAVGQLDQTTQQNSALVEEMAAAAGALNEQAQGLVDAVSTFKLEGYAGAATHSQNTKNSSRVASATNTQGASARALPLALR